MKMGNNGINLSVESDLRLEGLVAVIETKVEDTYCGDICTFTYRTDLAELINEFLDFDGEPENLKQIKEGIKELHEKLEKYE